MSNKKITDNALDILANAQPRRITQNATRGAVRNVSKANYYQVRINRVQAAMLAFVGFVYERQNGYLINVDMETGQLLITAPFTRSGFSDYGIKKAEGLALQKIIMGASKQDQPVWWLLFDDDIKRWFVNLADYRNPLQAQSYLESISIERRFFNAWRQVAAARYTAQQSSTENLNR